MEIEKNEGTTNTQTQNNIENLGFSSLNPGPQRWRHPENRCSCHTTTVAAKLAVNNLLHI